MQYNVEDISPVKKKVTITVPDEEVNAALATTIAMYRTSVAFPGFRKGKAPSSMVEKRFQKEIYQEATTELVNVHINQIMGELKATPVSRIDFDGGELERDKEFVYSISYEVMPEFTVPDYDGFAVEQEETIVNEDEIESVVERVRNNAAEIVDVTEKRQPKTGDLVVVDFYATDEQGEEIAGVKADNFQLPLGENQTLPDFETLICTLQPEDTGSGPVTFPEDFFNPEFAGKTVTMHVTLRGIKERKLPELNDEFAQKAGGVDSMDKLRETIRESYVKSRDDLNRSVAQKTLLDNILKLTDFALPESMVAGNIQVLIDDLRYRLERQGKGLASLGKTEEELQEEVRPEAEARARSQVLLLTVARQLELEIAEQEVEMQLHRIAMQSGQDFAAVKDYYIQNNLIYALRDRMLADKAMEAIYSKAKITFVVPKDPGAEKE